MPSRRRSEASAAAQGPAAGAPDPTPREAWPACAAAVARHRLMRSREHLCGPAPPPGCCGRRCSSRAGARVQRAARWGRRARPPLVSPGRRLGAAAAVRTGDGCVRCDRLLPGRRLVCGPSSAGPPAASAARCSCAQSSASSCAGVAVPCRLLACASRARLHRVGPAVVLFHGSERTHGHTGKFFNLRVRVHHGIWEFLKSI